MGDGLCLGLPERAAQQREQRALRMRMLTLPLGERGLSEVVSVCKPSLEEKEVMREESIVAGELLELAGETSAALIEGGHTHAMLRHAR